MENLSKIDEVEENESIIKDNKTSISDNSSKDTSSLKAKTTSFLTAVKEITKDITAISSSFIFSKVKKSFFSMDLQKYMGKSDEQSNSHIDHDRQNAIKNDNKRKYFIESEKFVQYKSNKKLIHDFGPHPNADIIDLSMIKKIYNRNPNLVLHTVNLVDEINKEKKMRKEKNKLLFNVDNSTELEELDIVYKAETHKVLTKDGFILTVFRINANCDINDQESKIKIDYSGMPWNIQGNEESNIDEENNNSLKRNNSFSLTRNRAQTYKRSKKNDKQNIRMQLESIDGFNENDEEYFNESGDNNENDDNYLPDTNTIKEMTQEKKNYIEDNILMGEININDSKNISISKQNKKKSQNKMSIIEKKNDNKRILFKKLNKSNNSKKAILIQHGVSDSSDGFLCNSEDRCLPLVLAKMGYDVWLGNCRGNYYSEEHLYLDKEKDSTLYYDFSFDEMGRFDIPAVIQKLQSIRKNNNKISCIAHSQGGATLLAGMAFNNEFYSSKLDLFVGLSPVSTLVSLNSNILKLMAYSKVERFFTMIGWHSVGHRNKTLSYLTSKHLNNLTIKLGKRVDKQEKCHIKSHDNVENNVKGKEQIDNNKTYCSTDTSINSLRKNRTNIVAKSKATAIIPDKTKNNTNKNEKNKPWYTKIGEKLNCCSKCKVDIDISSVLLSLLTDKNSHRINDFSALNKLISYNPSGVSVKSVIHFLYNYHSNRFSRFDYGRNLNLELYHTSYAPDYLLEKITVPTVLLYGTYDRLSNEDDIDSIHCRMMNSVIDVKGFDNIGHLSYECGKDFSWFKHIEAALNKIENK